MPPPSSGGVTMAMIFNMLEGWDLLPRFGSAELYNLETEAMRWAYVDRNRWLGDPDFVDMPLDRLLSKSYAAELRRRIEVGRAGKTPLEPAPTEGEQTTHYSVVDAEGDGGRGHHHHQLALRQLRGGRRRRLPAQQRDGRLRGQARHAQPVRSGAGRGERDRARQAHAVVDEPDDRGRPQGEAADAWWARRAAPPSSPA